MRQLAAVVKNVVSILYLNNLIDKSLNDALVKRLWEIEQSCDKVVKNIDKCCGKKKEKANPEHQVRLILEALSDKGLTDKAFRILSTFILKPQKVSKQDMQWARDEVSKLEWRRVKK